MDGRTTVLSVADVTVLTVTPRHPPVRVHARHMQERAARRLQQLALAKAGVAADEDVDVAAHGHAVALRDALAHAAQQRQQQACLRPQLSCLAVIYICSSMHPGATLQNST